MMEYIFCTLCYSTKIYYIVFLDEAAFPLCNTIEKMVEIYPERFCILLFHRWKTIANI